MQFVGFGVGILLRLKAEIFTECIKSWKDYALYKPCHLRGINPIFKYPMINNFYATIIPYFLFSNPAKRVVSALDTAYGMQIRIGPTTNAAPGCTAL